MWFVEPVPQENNKLKWLQKLLPDEEKSLRSIYSIEAGTIPKELAQKYIQLLLTIKRKGHWITCNCKGGMPPVMTVCQRGQSIYIRRVPSFPEHEKSCLFYREQAEQSDSSPERRRPEGDALFGIYKSSETIGGLQTANNQSAESGSTGARLPRLGNSLFRLLEKAQLNQVMADSLLANKSPDYFEALRQIAQQCWITKSQKLSDFFWTHPKQVGFAAIKIKESASAWPKTSVPHGFMAVVAKRIENNLLYCELAQETVTVKLAGKIKLSSGRLGERSGPFLVLFTIGAEPGSTFYQPLDAFAVPVYSSWQLFPVESHYERMVLKMLLNVVKALKQKHQISLVIEKPLFDMKVKEDLFCRPDFILKSDRKTLIIEVMGSEEEAYLASKARTHPIMQQLGELMEFDSLTAEKSKDWNLHLDQLAKRIYAFFLR
jgi:hypothetical protein